LLRIESFNFNKRNQRREEKRERERRRRRRRNRERIDIDRGGFVRSAKTKLFPDERGEYTPPFNKKND
jgi:hypothetical protein